MPDSPVASAPLPLSQPAMRDVALRALEIAKRRGATGAEVEVSAAVGQSVTVRRGEVETVEYNRDKGLEITVYIGKRRGNASTSDLGVDALERTVEAACAIARHTAEDAAAGLPDADRLYRGAVMDLDLNHPWGLGVEDAIGIARTAEAAALGVDKRITNTEGATVGSYDNDFVLANSLGFCAGFPTSKCSVSVSVVAEDAGGMQRDYWYTSERDPARLQDAGEVGREAGRRAVRRLGGKRIRTVEAPVLFDANIAGGSSATSSRPRAARASIGARRSCSIASAPASSRR